VCLGSGVCRRQAGGEGGIAQVQRYPTPLHPGAWKHPKATQLHHDPGGSERWAGVGDGRRGKYGLVGGAAHAFIAFPPPHHCPTQRSRGGGGANPTHGRMAVLHGHSVPLLFAHPVQQAWGGWQDGMGAADGGHVCL
jgi:hypothetical protein